MLAIALNNKMMNRFAPIYLLIYFLPVVTPMVPVAVMWKWIYDSQYGLLNFFLSFFNISPKAWLIDKNLALYAIAIMSIWKVIGYYMVIFIVGLKNIPKNFYEAASIDGAKRLQAFIYITLPLLRFITFYVLVISVIQAFNVFTQVYVMTSDIQGAPGNLVRVLVYDIYENGFRFFKMGYASSEAVMLLLIVLSITFFEYLIVGRGDE
jgi:multiple sugar transport system permease protein